MLMFSVWPFSPAKMDLKLAKKAFPFFYLYWMHGQHYSRIHSEMAKEGNFVLSHGGHSIRVILEYCSFRV